VGWHDERLVDGPGIVVGRKGNPGVITWAYTGFYPIDTTFYVVPKEKGASVYFLFYALRLHDLPSLGADSAVPGLNRNMVYMSQQLIPSPQVVQAFDAFARPLYARLYESDVESRTLAAIRDALLPELLSGEIRIKDAGRFLKEHGV
jgi:type I restriction enzyme S subunit